MQSNSNENQNIILRIENLKKSFGAFTAINDLSLDIRDGEFFTIVGPSGSGKSTLLRILAGLEQPTSGNIYIQDELVNDVPANKRPTAMVFQSLALFNHKSVADNIEFSLKMKGVDAKTRRTRCLELMEMVHLDQDFLDKPVTKCSGGERQRVALARGLASDPDILFFDEPLSAMDFRLRKLLEVEFIELHKKAKKTFIYITHSLEEAMIMSDRIAILRAGEIVQLGTPDEIYTKPNSRFVSEFMGEVNMLEVTISEDGLKLYSPSLNKELKVENIPNGFSSGTLIVRPESMKFVDIVSDDINFIRGDVINNFSLGSRIQYHVDIGGQLIIVEELRLDASGYAIGDSVTIGWDTDNGVLVNE